MTQEQARQAMLAWLRSWRPAVYARIAAEHPELISHALGDVAGDGFAIDYDSGDFRVDGLGGWNDALSSWTDALTQTATSYLRSKVDQAAMRLQARLTKRQQPPAPTPVVQQQAQRVVQASPSASGAAGGFAAVPWWGWALAAAGGAFFLARRK